MNLGDPKLTALQFNEFITRHDVGSLSKLMADDHVFVDREGKSVRSKEKMTAGWDEFFRMFPDYMNTFVRVESREDSVIMVGYAYWNEKDPHDSAIWVARIENDLVAEWRIYEDTDKNREKFGLR